MRKAKKHMKNAVLANAALVLGALTASGANASVVYQSIPDLTVTPTANGYCSQCSSDGQFVGQTFSLASNASITSLLFDVTSYYNFPTDVTVSFFSDAGGVLGAQLFSQTFTPAQFASDTPTANSTDIVGLNLSGPLNLVAGSYDVFFSNPTDMAIPVYSGSGAIFSTTPLTLTTGTKYNKLNDFNGNTSSVGVVLFSGPVPEPATWAMMLMGFGLIGFGLRNRRKPTVRVTYA